MSAAISSKNIVRWLQNQIKNIPKNINSFK
jgi:hypothetical protein